MLFFLIFNFHDNSENDKLQERFEKIDNLLLKMGNPRFARRPSCKNILEEINCDMSGAVYSKTLLGYTLL